jgi:hypothetical protein
MLLGFDDVVRWLRRYKGQFWETNIGIRHLTAQCENKSPCCPLAFLSQEVGGKPKENGDFLSFEQCLKLDPEMVWRIVRVADDKISSDYKLLVDACC